MATFLSITGVSIGVEDQYLKCVPSIQYLVKFKKYHTEVQALLDSNSEINAIIQAYTAKLGLYVYLTDIGAQKID